MTISEFFLPIFQWIGSFPLWAGAVGLVISLILGFVLDARAEQRRSNAILRVLRRRHNVVIVFTAGLALSACGGGAVPPVATGPWQPLNVDQWTPTEADLAWLPR